MSEAEFIEGFRTYDWLKPFQPLDLTTVYLNNLFLNNESFVNY